jgi:hypothetical protein
MIGKIISHYRILEKLSAGGVAFVYKAQDSRLGHQGPRHLEGGWLIR